MRRRVVLALGVAVLLGAGLWLELLREAKLASAARAELRLPAFDARKVTAVELTTRSGLCRVVRGQRGWRIVSPVDDAASGAAVEALIGAVSRASIMETIKKPEALSSYGLAPPVTRLRLEGVKVPEISLGDVVPTGDRLYAQVAGREGVLLLALPDAAPLVAPDAGRLRDRSLVAVGKSAIGGVTIEPGNVRLTRRDDGWWIDARHPLPASAIQVDKLLGAIVDAKVVGADDAGERSDPRYGLGALALHVVLRAGSETCAITLGADAGGGRRFAACEGRGGILLVDAAPFVALPLDVEALRDTRLTSVNRYDVRHLVYASQGKRFMATRTDDATWTTASGAHVDAAEVYALLVRLLEAPTTSWSERAPSGHATATLEYVTAKGAQGSIAYYGDQATWSEVPGVLFRLAEGAGQNRSVAMPSSAR